MQRSRRRQFEQTRQSYKGYDSDNSSMASSITSSYHPKLNPQNTKKEACFNCINKIMAEKKAKQQKKQKRKAQREQRNNLKMVQKNQDPSFDNRQRIASEAMKYNQQAIRNRIIAKAQEKEKQLQMATSLQLSDSKMQIDMKNCFKKDKQRNKQYRQQLFIQLQQEKQRKAQEKAKQKEGLIITPVVQITKPYDQVNYRKQLQKQIAEREQNRKRQKQQTVKQEQKLLEKYEEQAGLCEPKKVYNPQIFTEMKQIQQKKINNTLQKRRQQQKQRKLQMKDDVELRNQYIHEKIRNMQMYVKDLSHQIVEKKAREETQKKKERQENADQFEEEYSKNRQLKDCLECYQAYPVQYIGRIPQV